MQGTSQSLQELVASDRQVRECMNSWVVKCIIGLCKAYPRGLEQSDDTPISITKILIEEKETTIYGQQPRPERSITVLTGLRL